MKKIYINGFGLNLGDITTESELLELVGKKKKVQEHCVESIAEFSKLRKFRRMDRFSLLTQMSVQALANSIHIEEGEYSAYDYGSVINTSYGCLDTKINFVNELLENDINRISAINFSHTVYNAALGHTCKNFGLKGPSTMVLSSNYIFIAMEMLNKGKAKCCLAGGVEVYLKELSEYMESIGVKLTECGCFLGLSVSMDKECMAEIVDFSSCNLLGHPYLERLDIDEQSIYKSMNDLIVRNGKSTEEIDFVVGSSLLNSQFDAERIAVKNLFSKQESIPIIDYTGETLGASLGVSILYAASRLKAGKEKCAIINNYDIGGNFLSFMISSVE